MPNLTRILALTAVLAGALWYLTFGSVEHQRPYSNPGGFDFPRFTLPVLDPGLLAGDTTFLSWEEVGAKATLVAFWATWCAPCLSEQAILLALEEEFRDRDFRVIGVLHEDNAQRALEWLASNDRLGMTHVVGTRSFAREAGVRGLPHTFLVAGNGRVIEYFTGWGVGSEAHLRDRIGRLVGR